MKSGDMEKLEQLFSSLALVKCNIIAYSEMPYGDLLTVLSFSASSNQRCTVRVTSGIR